MKRRGDLGYESFETCETDEPLSVLVITITDSLCYRSETTLVLCADEHLTGVLMAAVTVAFWDIVC